MEFILRNKVKLLLGIILFFSVVAKSHKKHYYEKDFVEENRRPFPSNERPLRSGFIPYSEKYVDLKEHNHGPNGRGKKFFNYYSDKQFLRNSNKCPQHSILVNGDCVDVTDVGLINFISMIISGALFVLLAVVVIFFSLRLCKRFKRICKWRMNLKKLKFNSNNKYNHSNYPNNSNIDRRHYEALHSENSVSNNYNMPQNNNDCNNNNNNSNVHLKIAPLKPIFQQKASPLDNSIQQNHNMPMISNLNNDFGNNFNYNPSNDIHNLHSIRNNEKNFSQKNSFLKFNQIDSNNQQNVIDNNINKSTNNLNNEHEIKNTNIFNRGLGNLLNYFPSLAIKNSNISHDNYKKIQDDKNINTHRVGLNQINANKLEMSNIQNNQNFQTNPIDQEQNHIVIKSSVDPQFFYPKKFFNNSSVETQKINMENLEFFNSNNLSFPIMKLKEINPIEQNKTFEQPANEFSIDSSYPTLDRIHNDYEMISGNKIVSNKNDMIN